jgi:hypothetical protein
MFSEHRDMAAAIAFFQSARQQSRAAFLHRNLTVMAILKAA